MEGAAGVIAWFRRWRAENARVRDAERRALSAFRDSRGHAGFGAWIVRRTEDETVVRVCFGDLRPPRRAWFAVPASAGAPVRELSWDEVSPMGEGERVWR